MAVLSHILQEANSPKIALNCFGLHYCIKSIKVTQMGQNLQHVEFYQWIAILGFDVGCYVAV